jgi:acyl carrier protein
MENVTLPSDINQRVREVIVKTFKPSAEDSRGELRMKSLPGWDSLGHMRLVVELEQEFVINFPTYTIAQLLDVESIARIVHSLQIKD